MRLRPDKQLVILGKGQQQENVELNCRAEILQIFQYRLDRFQQL